MWCVRKIYFEWRIFLKLIKRPAMLMVIIAAKLFLLVGCATMPSQNEAYFDESALSF